MIEMQWRKASFNERGTTGIVQENGSIRPMVLQYRHKSVRSKSQMDMILKEPRWQPAPDEWSGWIDVPLEE